jgi:hypothetical protein
VIFHLTAIIHRKPVKLTGGLVPAMTVLFGCGRMRFEIFGLN